MTPSRSHQDTAVSELPGFGLLEDRLARSAARRAFVESQARFIRAVSDACGPSGGLLQPLDSEFPDTGPETAFVPL